MERVATDICWLGAAYEVRPDFIHMGDGKYRLRGHLHFKKRTFLNEKFRAENSKIFYWFESIWTILLHKEIFMPTPLGGECGRNADPTSCQPFWRFLAFSWRGPLVKSLFSHEIWGWILWENAVFGQSYLPMAVILSSFWGELFWQEIELEFWVHSYPRKEIS